MRLVVFLLALLALPLAGCEQRAEPDVPMDASSKRGTETTNTTEDGQPLMGR
ncbi:MAG: hypothetical protein JNK63_00105 [Chthonomonas sp.]|nr:hypothetical protein [Chthonomonas sp.]